MNATNTRALSANALGIPGPPPGPGDHLTRDECGAIIAALRMIQCVLLSEGPTVVKAPHWTGDMKEEFRWIASNGEAEGFAALDVDGIDRLLRKFGI